MSSLRPSWSGISVASSLASGGRRPGSQQPGSVSPSNNSNPRNSKPSRSPGAGATRGSQAEEKGVRLEQRWAKFNKLAKGCTEAYMPTHIAGMRLHRTGKSKVGPAKVLQIGLPVLICNPSDHNFEHRILKTDNRKTYLYFLKSLGKDGRRQDPITIKLLEIEKVLGGSEAMRICQANSVRHHSLDARSVVILQNGKSDTETPVFEKITILVAPPAMELQKLIELLMHEVAPRAASQGPAGGVAAVAATSLVGGKKATKAAEEDQEPEYWWGLDAVRIKEQAKVFDENPQADLELRLKPLNDKGLPGKGIQVQNFTVGSMLASAKHESLMQGTNAELVELQAARGAMRPLDKVRLRLVIHEIALFTTWSSVVTEVFVKEGGLFKFLTDPRSIMLTKEVREDIVDIMREAIPPEMPGLDLADSICRNNLHAVADGLKQTFNFEIIYAQAFHGKLLLPEKLTPFVEEEALEAGQAGGQAEPVRRSEEVEGAARKEVEIIILFAVSNDSDRELDITSLTCEQPGKASSRVTLKRHPEQVTAFVMSLPSIPHSGEPLMFIAWQKGVGNIDNNVGHAMLEGTHLADQTSGELVFRGLGGEAAVRAQFKVAHIEQSLEMVEHGTFLEQATAVLGVLQGPTPRTQHAYFADKASAVLEQLEGPTPRTQHANVVHQANTLLGQASTLEDASQTTQPHAQGKRKAIPKSFGNRLVPRLHRGP